MPPLPIKRLVAATILLFSLSQFSDIRTQSPGKSVWVPDNRNGTYRNPIIAADYSDPDVVRVGSDFYLTASSFNCVPGLPVLHSKDLVNWRIIAHVFEQQTPREVFSKPQHGNGVWAPSIRFHNGMFYIFYGDPDFGIYMSRSRNPAGPWTAPLRIKEARGWIDTCPFWDDDGNAYLVHAWANSRSGIKSILTINRMSADGTRLLDEGQTVFEGRQHQPTIEGPKLYKRNGYYYIFAPAGGVPTGWQTVLRARNIFGPYEDRVVMDQGRTSINGPHQGGWVELESGESWFIHFQDRGPYGRVVHLQPMHWQNDWPVIGVDDDNDGKGEPVEFFRKPDVGRRYPIQVPQTSDEFKEGRLGLQWQWHANFADDWASLRARRGWLRLRPVSLPEAPNLWAVPNLLLQKLPAFQFVTTTRFDISGLRAGERTGLVMMGMDYSYIALVRTEFGMRIVKVVDRDAPSGSLELEEESIDSLKTSGFLRIAVNVTATCTFSYSLDGREWKGIGRPFHAREGRWIGAKIGLFALGGKPLKPSGYADFDWFRIESN